MDLTNCNVTASLAVSDMDKAKGFYEDSLGLSGGGVEADGGITYSCGGGTELHVYPSQYAGQSGATIAFWATDDVEGTVDELTSKGVTFEQYDMDQLKTNEKGIAQFGDEQGAWFKDPDGNVLAIGNPPKAGSDGAG